MSGIPTDEDYKVSFSVVNPADKKILNEVSVQSGNSDTLEIPISVAFTTSLGVGRFFYGIKLTDSLGEEQTVIPKATEDEEGHIAIANPPSFIVKPLIVEGGTNNG